jgi:hypothetical protein
MTSTALVPSIIPASAQRRPRCTTPQRPNRQKLNLDGAEPIRACPRASVFDHMLDQIARHGLIDLDIHCDGDLHIDGHHGGRRWHHARAGGRPRQWAIKVCAATAMPMCRWTSAEPRGGGLFGRQGLNFMCRSVRHHWRVRHAAGL